MNEEENKVIDNVVENSDNSVPALDDQVDNSVASIPVLDDKAVENAVVENNASNTISNDNVEVNNLDNNSSSVDGFYEYQNEDEPVIQKVIDVDKRKKIIIGCIIISLILVIGIVCFIVFGNHKTSKTHIEKRVANNYSSFVNTINDSIASGDFDKEISKALKDIKMDTSELLFVCLDIDSDSDNELVAYAS